MLPVEFANGIGLSLAGSLFVLPPLFDRVLTWPTAQHHSMQLTQLLLTFFSSTLGN